MTKDDLVKYLRSLKVRPGDGPVTMEVGYVLKIKELVLRKKNGSHRSAVSGKFASKAAAANDPSRHVHEK